MATVLIVEDEEHLAETLRFNMAAEGYSPSWRIASLLSTDGPLPAVWSNGYAGVTACSSGAFSCPIGPHRFRPPRALSLCEPFGIGEGQHYEFECRAGEPPLPCVNSIDRIIG